MLAQPSPPIWSTLGAAHARHPAAVPFKHDVQFALHASGTCVVGGQYEPIGHAAGWLELAAQYWAHAHACCLGVVELPEQ